MPMKFAFNDSKALAALAFIANERPGVTPLFVAKILFFAEKWHINRYGRPIIADTYIAMVRGPVPSTIKNFIDEKWDWVDRPDGFDEAITISSKHWIRRVMPGQGKPNVSCLSETDMECLRAAIDYCKNKTSGELSELTHFERAWRNAPTNGPMNYEDFVDEDNENKEAILLEMREFAACGVL
jgi:uncharacterized phage-associated protein